MMKKRRLFWGRMVSCAGAAAVLLLAAAGCSRPKELGRSIDMMDLLGRLTNITDIARLEGDRTELISSFDPTGGNDDFNHPLRKGAPGWVVLADLKGPGYVARFWFTGGEPTQRVRFYFDGETTPRWETTMAELCGGGDVRSPLAGYENYCWYTYLPIPYAKRLVIETQEGGTKPDGWPRLFHQINVVSLPRGTSVRSFSGTLTDEERQAVEAARRVWTKPTAWVPANLPRKETNVVLDPGSQVHALRLSGPAVIRRLAIRPDWQALARPSHREAVLRNILVRIRWNGSEQDSVVSPLGDLCGVFWRRVRYESFYFGMTDGALELRFPMPFEQGAEILVQNQGAFAVPLHVEAEFQSLETWDPGWGYFHAGWWRTTPGDLGRPHPILHVKGRGRFAGCTLGVVSQDPSYWILEGDETIRRDGEKEPGWRGTGLEDYFNGGWYYRNVLTRPLHGLPVKTPFRTVQYRMHLPDPVRFEASFDMEFERGPNHASRGWFESIAYYYMDRPQPAFARIGAVTERQPPPNPYAQAAIMTDLWNAERLGDWEGAASAIDLLLEQQPGFEYRDVLALRRLAYRERREGFAAVQSEYKALAEQSSNEYARNLARSLLWYHESPSNACLAAYCNAPSRLFLDGQLIGEFGHPEQMALWGVQMKPGRHVLAVQFTWRPYPDWALVALRTHQGDIVTGEDWKQAVNPQGDWAAMDYDDSSWKTTGPTGLVKGPPEEPYLWVVPDAHVDLQSRATGLRATVEWPARKGHIVFRHVFDWPPPKVP